MAPRFGVGNAVWVVGAPGAGDGPHNGSVKGLQLISLNPAMAFDGDDEWAPFDDAGRSCSLACRAMLPARSPGHPSGDR